MLIVPDVDDMFVPISDGFLVDPYESQHIIEPWLEALPTMFAENRTSESVIGSVSQAVVKYLVRIGVKSFSCAIILILTFSI
jgi:protein transport protein SEC24